jgi:putative nucleotidyltransferase with HDIG domain
LVSAAPGVPAPTLARRAARNGRARRYTSARIIEEERMDEQRNPSQIGIEATVDALTQAMVVWDEDNYRHCLRTADYASAIAREMGIAGEAVEHIRIAALLHDIGKIGVDLALLRKPGPLTHDELERIRLHPRMGAQILERVLPGPIVQAVAAHHEQPDGCGYPDGLRAKQIPVSALICRVADVLESLTTRQAYRPPLSLRATLDELREGAGAKYGRAPVEALLRLIERRDLRIAA